jgi:serine/threonine protein kinase
MPVDGTLRPAAEIVDALDVPHRKGIVHGHLKPVNILCCRD